jgi:hypothetical protein
MKVQAGRSIRMGSGSYQVAGSQAEGPADVEELPGSPLAELFLSDLCGELYGRIVGRVINEESWEETRCFEGRSSRVKRAVSSVDISATGYRA